MDASAARTAEKKDKMDGSGFSDLPKKPSETRGKFLPRRICASPRHAGGQRGEANADP